MARLGAVPVHWFQVSTTWLRPRASAQRARMQQRIAETQPIVAEFARRAHDRLAQTPPRARTMAERVRRRLSHRRGPGAAPDADVPPAGGAGPARAGVVDVRQLIAAAKAGEPPVAGMRRPGAATSATAAAGRRRPRRGRLVAALVLLVLLLGGGGIVYAFTGTGDGDSDAVAAAVVDSSTTDGTEVTPTRTRTPKPTRTTKRPDAGRDSDEGDDDDDEDAAPTARRTTGAPDTRCRRTSYIPQKSPYRLYHENGAWISFLLVRGARNSFKVDVETSDDRYDGRYDVMTTFYGQIEILFKDGYDSAGQATLTPYLKACGPWTDRSGLLK